MKLTEQIEFIDTEYHCANSMYKDGLCLHIKKCPSKIIDCHNCIGAIPLKHIADINPDMSTKAVQDTVILIKVFNLQE